ncbi:hypothetical protein COP2_022341 [Malus domestica]
MKHSPKISGFCHCSSSSPTIFLFAFPSLSQTLVFLFGSCSARVSAARPNRGAPLGLSRPLGLKSFGANLSRMRPLLRRYRRL